MAESEEELMSLLMKVKKESEKNGLELNIQNTKIMTSSSITSWQIDGLLAYYCSGTILGINNKSMNKTSAHEITALLEFTHNSKSCASFASKWMVIY